jgi:hypothetical protein
MCLVGSIGSKGVKLIACVAVAIAVGWLRTGRAESFTPLPESIPSAQSCVHARASGKALRMEDGLDDLAVVAAEHADSCKCYCGGQSWSPGAIACMGDFKYVCADRNNDGRNCGWDPVKLGPDPVRCDGGEVCK